ncbi:MAG: hypothetical protein V1838_05115 [Patescibacteria group bacterium]
MKKHHIIGLVLVLAFAFTMGAGCGEKTAEKKAENAIESATNQDVDVDLDNDTVTINTSEGSFSSGENISLPDSFPSDVHVVSGTITAATTVTENEAYSVSVETTKSVADVKSEYEDQLAADGWTVTMSLSIGTGTTIGAEKGDRTVTITIDQADNGKTVVILATSTSQ